jgi:hypothetical protein
LPYSTFARATDGLGSVHRPPSLAGGTDGYGVHGVFRVSPAFRRTSFPLTAGHDSLLPKQLAIASCFAPHSSPSARRHRVRALQQARRDASRGGKTRSKLWFVGLRHRPPRPSNACAFWPSRDLRSGRIPPLLDGGCATLLTFVPSFPTLPGPCDPVIPSPGSSHGVVQRSPLHRHRPKSPLPDACASFGEGCHTLPRSALVVLHHLDGLLLFDLAGLFHPAADPGVRRVSTGRETSFPATPSCPSKPSLRR